jgi:putative endonuclease
MFHGRKSEHLRVGKQGETLAVWYLRLSGYRIVERNFRCRLGEIDIIARKRNLLVFVEVRTRTSGSLQHPLETVDHVKVFRTVQAAQRYLLGTGPSLPFCRFDVIGLMPEKRFPLRRLWHLKNAFDITSIEYRQGCRREMESKRRRFGKRGKR